MDKYKKYYGVMIFGAAVVLLLFAAFKMISPKVTELNSLKTSIASQQKELSGQKKKQETRRRKSLHRRRRKNITESLRTKLEMHPRTKMGDIIVRNVRVKRKNLLGSSVPMTTVLEKKLDSIVITMSANRAIVPMIIVPVRDGRTRIMRLT